MHQQPCLDEEEKKNVSWKRRRWKNPASMHMFGIMSVFFFLPRNFPEVLQQTVLTFLRERRCSGVLPGAQAAKVEGGRWGGGRCSPRGDSANQSPKWLAISLWPGVPCASPGQKCCLVSFLLRARSDWCVSVHFGRTTVSFCEAPPSWRGRGGERVERIGVTSSLRPDAETH